MSKEMIELSNEEVKAKIEAGETIENAHIKQLNMGKYDVKQPINLIECKIDMIDLNKAQLQEDVTIRRCEIEKLVFSEATFHKKCDLKKSKINRGRVQKTIFKGNVICETTNFAFTSFHSSVFEGEKADFNRSNFYGDATFTNAVFKGSAKFPHVRIEGSGEFSETQWHGPADFKRVEIGGSLNFYRSKFQSDLLLQGAQVKLSISIASSELEGFVDLSHVIVTQSIDLNNVKVGEKQGFRFTNAMAGSLLLEREFVEGHVFPENENKYAQAAKEYGFLRATFRSINRFEDEDWAYYQFKRMQRKGKTLSKNPFSFFLRGLEYVFVDLGCGYGTMPFRTLAMGGILILIFSLCYFFSFGATTVLGDYGFANMTVNNFFYSLDISITAFSGGYGDLGDKVTGSMRILAMIEYLIGVVFMGLFIVSFSRKVIR